MKSINIKRSTINGYQFGMREKNLDQIKYRSLAEGAVEALRDAIITGNLGPGTRLVEQKLAAQLGIGQPTLREALKELEHQGFVRKFGKKGTYVTRLGPDDFRKILEVRLTLEVKAIELAAQHVTQEALDELGRLVDEMDAGVRADDLPRFHNADLAFHSKIWELSGNEYLGIALERIAFALFAFVLFESNATGKFEAAVEQHREIFAGLRSRNPKIAREQFVRSTLSFWNRHHRVQLDEAGFLE